MLKVAWVKANTNWQCNKPIRWLPVYLPAHIDPEISDASCHLHYHIAWNRVAEGDRPRLGFPLNHFPVFASDIIDFNYKRPTPIVGPPVPSKNLTFDTWRYYLNRNGKLPMWPPAKVFHGPINITWSSAGYSVQGMET